MSQSSTPVAATTSLLSNSAYNVLKHVASIALPLIAALYFAVSQIWSLPDVAQVMATIVTINTILGGVLGYSTVTYNASEAKYAGVIELVEGDTKDIAQLVFHDDTANVLAKAEALFRIEKKPAVTPTTAPPSGGTTAHGASI